MAAAARSLLLGPLLALLLLPLLAAGFLLAPRPSPLTTLTTPARIVADTRRTTAQRLQASSSFDSSSEASRQEFLRSALVTGVAAAAASVVGRPVQPARADGGEGDDEEDDGIARPKTVEAYLTEIDKVGVLYLVGWSRRLRGRLGRSAPHTKRLQPHTNNIDSFTQP